MLRIAGCECRGTEDTSGRRCGKSECENPKYGEEHCERLASEPDVTVTQTNSQQLCSPPHKPELINISVEGDYQYLSLWPSC